MFSDFLGLSSSRVVENFFETRVFFGFCAKSSTFSTDVDRGISFHVPAAITLRNLMK